MEKNLIEITSLCSYYEVEFSFIDDLQKNGLIQIVMIEQTQFIHYDQIRDLEKMIRLHNDLNLNIEALDVVFNLLEKEEKLRDELKSLKNKLQIYEND